MNLSFEDMDRVITQGKELGIYLYMLTGGEPLVRKKDVIRLCEKHNDCVFHAFTNGTLVDDEFCQEMQRVGNLSLSISLEGYEEVNDGRRGKGVYLESYACNGSFENIRLDFLEHQSAIHALILIQ
mgnify:CR=1 FL=1